jgi:hypothetical protein
MGAKERSSSGLTSNVRSMHIGVCVMRVLLSGERGQRF